MLVTAVTLCPGVRWDIAGHTIQTWIEGICKQIEHNNTPARAFLVNHLRALGTRVNLDETKRSWRSNVVLQGMIDVLKRGAGKDEAVSGHPNTWEESRVFDRIMTEEYDKLLRTHLHKLGLSIDGTAGLDQSMDATGMPHTPYTYTTSEQTTLLDLHRVRLQIHKRILPIDGRVWETGGGRWMLVWLTA